MADHLSVNLSAPRDAKVYGYAWVSDNAEVFGNAKVYDYAEVYGNAKVYGNAEVYGYAEVYEGFIEKTQISDTKINEESQAEAMEETKYGLSDETMEFEGHTLHRIKALTDFGDVKAGDLGGWVESEDNLSQVGKCWVAGEAKVFAKAKVYDNAEILTDAFRILQKYTIIPKLNNAY